MKKIFVIASILSSGIALVSCGSNHRKPGHIYMPDMFVSRAYETYDARDTAFTTDENEAGRKIFYNNRPVTGTMYRGEDLPFPLTMDKPGDTTNYVAAKQIQNPEAPLTLEQFKETERLYLVYCGVCHGAKLDGNGPLYKDGSGPFSAKPANLSGADTKYAAMPDGQMFYSIEYGKNMMGSYASQLTRKQRWQIIHYIKAKQAQANGGTTAGKSDSTATVKK